MVISRAHTIAMSFGLVDDRKKSGCKNILPNWTRCSFASFCTAKLSLPHTTSRLPIIGTGGVYTNDAAVTIYLLVTILAPPMCWSPIIGKNDWIEQMWGNSVLRDPTPPMTLVPMSDGGAI